MKHHPSNPCRPLVALLSLVCFALLPAQSTWAASYKFDMGGDLTPLAAGYERVTLATTLAKHAAYGWTRIPQRVVFCDDPTNPYYGAGKESLEYALYSDGILSSEENTFEFKVEPGRYAVTATMGDLALGEDRPGSSIWANGVQVVSNETTDGSVKAFTFPVEAAQGKIVLRFMQKQLTVIAVTAEQLAAGQERKPSVVEYPVQRPGREEYRKNWQSYEARYVGMWEQARQELKADGIDVETWTAKRADFSQRKNYRSYSVSGLDNRSWSYMDKLAGGIHLDGIFKSFSEMGIDGIVGVHVVSAREFPKHGLQYALHSGGELLYGASNLTPNLMKNAAGATGTVADVFSNTDPKAMEAFRNYYRKSQGPYADGAAYMMIDEPRGNLPAMLRIALQAGPRGNPPLADRVFARLGGARLAKSRQKRTSGEAWAEPCEAKSHRAFWRRRVRRL